MCQLVPKELINHCHMLQRCGRCVARATGQSLGAFIGIYIGLPNPALCVLSGSAVTPPSIKISRNQGIISNRSLLECAPWPAWCSCSCTPTLLPLQLCCRGCDHRKGLLGCSPMPMVPLQHLSPRSRPHWCGAQDAETRFHGAAESELDFPLSADKVLGLL